MIFVTNFLLILKDDKIGEEVRSFLQTIFGYGIKMKEASNYLLITYQLNDELMVEENLKAFCYDTNLFIKCFIGQTNLESINDELIKTILHYLKKPLKANIYTEKNLLEELITLEDVAFKSLVLKDYLYDLEMQSILITFFKNNLNILKTAKILYLHRNTLINKLDRFYNITGYDPRLFEDAYIIYTLIKN